MESAIDKKKVRRSTGDRDAQREIKGLKFQGGTSVSSAAVAFGSGCEFGF